MPSKCRNLLISDQSSSSSWSGSGRTEALKNTWQGVTAPVCWFGQFLVSEARGWGSCIVEEDADGLQTEQPAQSEACTVWEMNVDLRDV